MGALNIARKIIILSPSWDRDNGLVAEPLLLKWNGMKWEPRRAVSDGSMKRSGAGTESAEMMAESHALQRWEDVKLDAKRRAAPRVANFIGIRSHDSLYYAHQIANERG